MISFISDVLGSINWEAIVQLTMLGAIAIAGPVVIFLLAARGGDL
uniref:Photosystem II reaction center protein Psb30 n=1 Tax=Cyanothece sp. (strain PCC 7425 / ATCC 29141) TaxID=395961 RepID=B8HKK5_CYAP4